MQGSLKWAVSVILSDPRAKMSMPEMPSCYFQNVVYHLCALHNYRRHERFRSELGIFMVLFNQLKFTLNFYSAIL